MSSIQHKVNRLNELLKEIQAYKAAHPETKLGYQPLSYGSLLNAYREGDLTFEECIDLLSKVQDGLEELKLRKHG